MVLELLGPKTDQIVSDYSEYGDPLETETILRISEQLLRGVAFLHEVGYVHGGKMVQMCVIRCVQPQVNDSTLRPSLT